MNIMVLAAIIIIAADLLFTLCACILCGREDEYMRRICSETRENSKTAENSKINNNELINND